MTTASESIQHLRARKTELERELATVNRMLDAADGKTAASTAPVIIVNPIPTAPQPCPILPTWPIGPAYQPYVPARSPGMPYPGWEIVCGGTIAIDAMPPRLDVVWSGDVSGFVAGGVWRNDDGTRFGAS